MKLIVSVVQAEDAAGLVRALLVKGHRATVINTTGGFLRRASSTVLSGVKDTQVPSVLQIIRRNCRARVEALSPVPADDELQDLYVPTSVEVGGATVFVIDIEEARAF